MPGAKGIINLQVPGMRMAEMKGMIELIASIAQITCPLVRHSGNVFRADTSEVTVYLQIDKTIHVHE